MRARSLQSSMIRRIMFDEDENRLSIWFRQSGLRYVYDGVPRAVYDAMGKAASAGRFFNEHIKGHYRCHPVPGQRKYRPIAD